MDLRILGSCLGGDEGGHVGEHPDRFVLAHGHAAAVQGAAAQGARPAQQLRVERPVDHIGDP
ncbi:hypothetical protein J7E89_39470 [Streptomyces sp. ISL-100]|nr:hypothetical protein [Streptomyces sp. ISL-100]MBT2401835.1 hypothetical protein [Streptomyces sp. ISL-100]